MARLGTAQRRHFPVVNASVATGDLEVDGADVDLPDVATRGGQYADRAVRLRQRRWRFSDTKLLQRESYRVGPKDASWPNI